MGGHVCANWQRLSLGLPALWSHIDLVPPQFRNTNLKLQLDTYMTRSRQTLLDLHIFESISNGGIFHSKEPDPELVKFLAVISPRVRSIDISVSFGPPGGHFFRLVLAACFAGCKSNTLKRIAIDVMSEQIGSSFNDHFHALTEQSEEVVEALCLGVVDLRLNYFFPSWDSKVYHRLTVLHLLGSESISIPEFQLVAILQSSPDLRVLKFGVMIESPYAGCHLVASVFLENLEVLVILSDREWDLGYLLRWIFPGVKPLSLSIVSPFLGGQKFRTKGELSSFFARWNVTRLHTRSFEEYSQLVEVLSLAPTVRVLAFNCYGPDEDIPPQDFTLHALYVIRLPVHEAFYWPSIETFIKKHKVEALSLWRHESRYDMLGGRERGV